MFYIKDYFRLIAIEDTYKHNKSAGSYAAEYEETADLNGYKISYSYCYTYDLYGRLIHYIKFILYKDDVIYIVNNYIPNKKFEVSIEHTCHSALINGRQMLSEYKFKMPGLSKKQLKDFFKAICIINQLKDSD